MRTIGRVILAFVIATNLFGEIRSELTSYRVKEGDYVGFVIESNSTDTRFPDIKEINGAKVYSTSYTNMVRSIKDRDDEIVSRITYYFYPINGDTIKPVEVIVDGKSLFTDELRFNLVAREVKASNLSLTLDRDSVYLGENFNLNLSLEYKEGDITRTIFTPAKFELFDIIEYKELGRDVKNGVVKEEIRYTLKPKKAGVIEIDPLNVKVVEKQDDGSSLMVTEHSNNALIDVKFPPQGVTLVGEFDLEMKVDKNALNEPVKVEYIITGSGNLNDLDDIVLVATNGARVFEQKPVIDSSSFTQEFGVIGSSSYTIKGITIPYLDSRTDEVKLLKTDDIIIGKSSQIKPNLTHILLAFISGVISSALAFVIYKNRSKFYKTKEYKLRELIKYYGQNRELDMEIEKIEDNYKYGKSHKIDKKLISKIVSQISKS